MTCPTCDGWGRMVHAGEQFPCPECKGSGEALPECYRCHGECVIDITPDAVYSTEVECPVCESLGRAEQPLGPSPSLAAALKAALSQDAALRLENDLAHYLKEVA